MANEAEKTRDRLHAVAWAAFLQWALGQSEMRAEFKNDTGLDVYGSDVDVVNTGKMAQSAQMDARMKAFVRWATEKHYGLEHAPQSYRNEVANGAQAK